MLHFMVNLCCKIIQRVTSQNTQGHINLPLSIPTFAIQIICFEDLWCHNPYWFSLQLLTYLTIPKLIYMWSEQHHFLQPHEILKCLLRVTISLHNLFTLSLHFHCQSLQYSSVKMNGKICCDVRRVRLVLSRILARRQI